MLKRWHIFLLLLLPSLFNAQDAELPPDFRQHNLTEYNSSLLSPIFSLDRNQPRSLALWTRWQWQTVDGDPTTLLFNYTHRINENSAAGAGFFQHNTGIFLQTGGVLNYAYKFDLGGRSEIALGLNVLGYQQELADDRFQPNPDLPLPIFEETNDFILQLAPSVRFKYEEFSIGLVSENFIDYNFSTSEQQTGSSDKIYFGFMSYRFPVFIFGSSEDSYLQPTMYIKTLPGLDDQYGINGLFSTPKFWTQLGYNNFYGTSVGAGGRFFKNFSVGGLVEFGSENSFQGKSTSIEFITAYNFGEGDMRRRIVGFEVDEEEALAEEAETTEVEETAEETEVDRGSEEEMALALALAQKKQDSLESAREAREMALDAQRREENELIRREREQDSLAAVAQAERLQEQQRQDSIAQVRIREAQETAQRLEAQRKQDSIARLAIAEQAKQAEQEAVTPEPGEKYEETTTEDGLEPGYYLIANVFGTKKYFEAFMKTMADRGLGPKSFYRSINKYNYVYLGRYNSVNEARQARDSQLNGRYKDKLWIFRVVGN